jgi:hypothetical protein
MANLLISQSVRLVTRLENNAITLGSLSFPRAHFEEMLVLKGLVVFCFAMSLATASAFASESQAQPMNLPPQPSVKPAGIPEGYMMVSPCIAGMGEHWANPKNFNDVIYGTANGKLIFTEIMVPLTTLSSGFNYANLTAAPGHTIDHVAMEWHPKGHEGMMVPHYDVHAYYIPLAKQKAVCPNGVPDPDAAAMKM